MSHTSRLLMVSGAATVAVWAVTASADHGDLQVGLRTGWAKPTGTVGSFPAGASCSSTDVQLGTTAEIHLGRGWFGFFAPYPEWSGLTDAFPHYWLSAGIRLGFTRSGDR